MSFSGLCQVCESATADHACRQCGTQVCDNHFDRTQGVCAQCASVLDEGGEDGGGDRDDSTPGHDDTGPGAGMR
jgi:hypothetical protein